MMSEESDEKSLEQRGVPPPRGSTLIQAVCNKEQDRDYKQWVDWLQDSRVTSPVKLEQLQRADDNGFTALHYAILHYTPDLLYTALEVDEVDFNVRTQRDNLTPLLLAAQSSVKNSVLWLLQDGGEVVDTSAVDSSGRNAVHLAALDPHCQYTIETLVRQLGEELCFQQDQDGNSPLHLAAGLGNMAAVEGGLLSPELWCGEQEGGEEDEEEEEGDKDGEEEKKESTEMERMICITNNKQQTALHLAVENSHVTVTRAIVSVCPRVLVIADGNGDFPLHVACASGHVAVVKELLPTAAGKGREEREKLSRLEQYTLESVRTSNSKGIKAWDVLQELAQNHGDLASLLDSLTDNTHDLPRRRGNNCCVCL